MNKRKKRRLAPMEGECWHLESERQEDGASFGELMAECETWYQKIKSFSERNENHRIWLANSLNVHGGGLRVDVQQPNGEWKWRAIIKERDEHAAKRFLEWWSAKPTGDAEFKSPEHPAKLTKKIKLYQKKQICFLDYCVGIYYKVDPKVKTNVEII